VFEHEIHLGSGLASPLPDGVQERVGDLGKPRINMGLLALAAALVAGSMGRFAGPSSWHRQEP
jgi:hypothetical protein